MSWERFPDANRQEPWEEAGMVKAGDVSTNVEGDGLTIDTVGDGNGPLHITADMVPDSTVEADVETDE